MPGFRETGPAFAIASTVLNSQAVALDLPDFPPSQAGQMMLIRKHQRQRSGRTFHRARQPAIRPAQPRHGPPRSRRLSWLHQLGTAMSAPHCPASFPWWVGLWWGEFLSDDGFRYLAAVPALIATLTAALASGRRRRWWLVSACVCAPMLVLLPTVFAPPDENAIGYDLLFSPLTQTGALGYGGYAYWFMLQLVIFTFLGGYRCAGVGDA